MKLYHAMKQEHGDVAARSLVRKILIQEQGNVSRAASILGCSRLCIRRARDGTLDDGDRTPKHQPGKTETGLEQLILAVRQKTGYGKRRMRRHLRTKYGLTVSHKIIACVLKRHHVRRQVYKRSAKESKPLYDYAALLPFEEGQIDTKHIEDYGALGSTVFRLRKFHLPLYQWTYVDAKTKVRFLAYSDTLGQGLGRLFLGLVTLWLRSCDLHNPFHTQGDNGGEWCGGSKATEEELNRLLALTGASFRSIPAGKKYLQGIVERSHRTDDEEFYRPHLERLSTRRAFIGRAQQWQDTWNSLRQNWGRGMQGVTPLEKLRACAIVSPERILQFPVVILDDLLRIVKSGNYLWDHYPKMVAGAGFEPATSRL